MTDLLGLLALALVATGLIVLGWWLLVATEGVYLGRRVVIGLYDLFAPRYDRVKAYYREYEQRYLADPIMRAIAPHRSPLVLDVAAGTGRLPLALMRHPDFQGRVIALDLSRQMLHFAARNLRLYDDRVTFLWAAAEQLPFEDHSFDVVTCLEALEFMTRPEAVLRECVRVLRPGGLLLVTQRINTRLMPGKTWTSGQVQSLLEACGVVESHAQIWQVDYRKVWGRKAGEAPTVGARPAAEVVRCPVCASVGLRPTDAAWGCENCGAAVPVGADGVVELAARVG